MSSLIDDYISGRDPLLRENANRDSSFSSLQVRLSEEAIKEYVLSKLPEDVRKAHISGDMHIHNLSKGIVPYCLGADLRLLLNKGLITSRISTHPAKHFSSALDHIVNFTATICQEYAGAVAFADINTLLAPYIRNDRLTFDQVTQYIQSFVYNLNFPSRSGSESPFTNVILNLETPPHLSSEDVYIRDRYVGEYDDYLEDALLFNRALNRIFFSGDASNRPFTFPIPTLNITRESLNQSLYEYFETVSVYGIYYFFNYVGTGIKLGSKRSMCCRLTLDLDELSTPSGRWTYEGGTGSLGVVTINFPRLAYLSKDEDRFFDLLQDVLEKAKITLLEKEKLVNKSLESGLLPLTREYGINLNAFFRTIGVLGLNEMHMNLFGSPLSADPSFTNIVLKYLRSWTLETQHETGRLWNFELTPAEGSSWRLALLDKKLFPDIYTMGSGEEVYYTALITPPSEPLSLAERVRIEEELQSLFTGGTVFRAFIGDNHPSPAALEKILRRLLQTKIPYIDIVPRYSICPRCGTYYSGEVLQCNRCGSETDVYSRIVGYYRPSKNANLGKRREMMERLYINPREML